MFVKSEKGNLLFVFLSQKGKSGLAAQSEQSAKRRGYAFGNGGRTLSETAGGRLRKRREDAFQKRRYAVLLN